MSKTVNKLFLKFYGDDSQCEVTDAIFTLPNIVTFVRLLMVPTFLYLAFVGEEVAAAVVFAVAAATDFVDGQLARRTNAVSKLGRLLDPFVDRLLMVSGVLGVYLTGRVALWMILVIVIRDVVLLLGGAWALSRYRVRVDVIFAGKIATTLLFSGFAMLLLGWPFGTGLGLFENPYFPGFGAQAYFGIYFVYLGMLLSIVTTFHYMYACARAVRAAKMKAQ